MHSETLERARLARDARFDGRFYIGVLTTGIYCRPICPAVAPKRENVQLYPSAAAAGEAGFRPCLRCRPECSPGTPAWAGTSTTVSRGLRLIDGGVLDDGNVEVLAAKLGVTSRHLRRLFTRHVGASPQAVAHTRRLHFAKRLIDETALSMSDVAIAAGYGSVRRFNAAFRTTYDRTPRELRQSRAGKSRRSGRAGLTVRVPYRSPYSWTDVLRFYGMRAIPGVEEIDGDVYRRSLRLGEAECIIELQAHANDGFLSLRMQNVPTERIYEVVQKVRDVFDLDAPIDDICAALATDDRMRALLSLQAGVRVPGCWDGFELAVRAILGQQISVKAATTLSGRVASRYGTPLREPVGSLTHFFPDAAQLVRARFNNIGIVQSRADTLRRLAGAVLTRNVSFDPLQDMQDFHEQFTAIKGIGDWTAQYVMMRALKNPDAFPASDLGLVKALCPGERVSPATLATRAENWRPWRAYAAMLLWGSSNSGG
ncbi:MAG: Ada metal-binding domain-containing protein [Woeseia sp.]